MRGRAHGTRRLALNFPCIGETAALATALSWSFTAIFFTKWMSLVAVNHTKVGVASSLMSLVPVLLIPLVGIFFGERVSWRSVFGTLLSFTGVLLLFIK